jgi:hypothetical protein
MKRFCGHFAHLPGTPAASEKSHQEHCRTQQKQSRRKREWREKHKCNAEQTRKYYAKPGDFSKYSVQFTHTTSI